MKCWEPARLDRQQQPQDLHLWLCGHLLSLCKVESQDSLSLCLGAKSLAMVVVNSAFLCLSFKFTDLYILVTFVLLTEQKIYPVSSKPHRLPGMSKLR